MWAAEAEARAAFQPVALPFGDTDIVVPPMWEWPRTGLLALLCDDYDAWAALVLDVDDHEVWIDTDPTLDDCDDLIEAWEQATGQNLETIGRMWHILDQWPDQFEADVNRHCDGQDLRDLWAPGHGPSRLTWRRLGVLFDGLPGESLTKTAWANDVGETKLAELAKKPSAGFSPMSRTDLTIADLIDAVNYNTYVLQCVNTPKERVKSVPKPDPYPRPGVARKRGRFRQASPEAQKLLAYMRANQGAMPTGEWKDVPHLPKTG